ncbi:BlaI/MecI/CopY family transcriptional regulator [Alicyclobacillus sp. ALC3]|uniref:BlaI/MecI/CopY family transcriptional regulator n=1 Tax=Alicyclobacillus sp. ALC3 TaxID=2796143 RepID=UPI0023791056|nr:BlaI/MecI/CopY family transcriptional regulator [Alicyclobacillus sp. ALC3]WDL99105.1 BlaI/MecI/CopY family transcriptional regulator [Alicyclobacillus sp. ALC3]
MERESLREQVLFILQESGSSGLAEVCGALREQRQISMSAVQTVLNRLVDQGIAVRTGTRRHYLYEVKPTEESARQRAAKAAIDLLSQSGDVGLAHFVDTIERIKPETIEKLERLLEQRRAKKEREHEQQP